MPETLLDDAARELYRTILREGGRIHLSEIGPEEEPVVRRLAQGLTRKAVTTRLGLSERTVAAHIARLRELYDAETLFQLGWQMRRTERDSAS